MCTAARYFFDFIWKFTCLAKQHGSKLILDQNIMQSFFIFGLYFQRNKINKKEKLTWLDTLAERIQYDGIMPCRVVTKGALPKCNGGGRKKKMNRIFLNNKFLNKLSYTILLYACLSLCMFMNLKHDWL